MNDDSRQKKADLLENQVSVLLSSFDTVQIFCTKHVNGRTTHFARGGGNWYARYGQVKDWVTTEEARTAFAAQHQEPDV